jgi:hypothetical protein
VGRAPIETALVLPFGVSPADIKAKATTILLADQIAGITLT